MSPDFMTFPKYVPPGSFFKAEKIYKNITLREWNPLIKILLLKRLKTDPVVITNSNMYEYLILQREWNLTLNYYGWFIMPNMIY